jgi:hypothetical protein
MNHHNPRRGGRPRPPGRAKLGTQRSPNNKAEVNTKQTYENLRQWRGKFEGANVSIRLMSPWPPSLRLARDPFGDCIRGLLLREDNRKLGLPYGESPESPLVGWPLQGHNSICDDGIVSNEIGTYCESILRPCAALNGVSSALWADDSIRIPSDGPANWLNIAVLDQFTVSSTWFRDNVASPTWGTDDEAVWDSVADLNEVRHILRTELDQLQLFVGAGVSIQADDFQKRDWTQDLEDYASRQFGTWELWATSGTVVLANRTDLVFTSLIDSLSNLVDRISSYAQTLRCATLIVHRSLHSRRGLAEIIGIFVNERSWYLHHSAHPPEAPALAVEGRLPALMRRACSRPQPA